jgi:hypothetical protein
MKTKTVDHYIHLLQAGKFRKASALQPVVDVKKRIWRSYLIKWKEHYNL